MMKIWRVGWNTFQSLLRARILLAAVAIPVLHFLQSLSSLFFAARLDAAGAAEQAEKFYAMRIEGDISASIVYVHILMVLAGAYILPNEIKTGTILPTLGRALSRGQFLLGLVLGVNLLLLSYVGFLALMIGGVMLWGGVGPPFAMLGGLCYVLLTANIMAGWSLWFSTRTNAVIAVIAVIGFLLLPAVAEGVTVWSEVWGERAGMALGYLQPAWGLLGSREFFSLTRSVIVRDASYHLIGLAHGVSYLAIVFLLAYYSFRRRNVMPPS